MPNHASFLSIAGLMFLTGVGIPIMATWNAGLGQHFGSPALATFIIFCVGALIAGAVLLVSGVPQNVSFAVERPYAYLAAAFVIFYVLSITWAAPRIGIGNAVFFVLLGQLVAAAAIDHFGLWGAIKTEITPRRVAGIAVMAAGVYLARKTA